MSIGLSKKQLADIVFKGSGVLTSEGLSFHNAIIEAIIQNNKAIEKELEKLRNEIEQ